MYSLGQDTSEIGNIRETFFSKPNESRTKSYHVSYFRFSNSKHDTPIITIYRKKLSPFTKGTKHTINQHERILLTGELLVNSSWLPFTNNSPDYVF